MLGPDFKVVKGGSYYEVPFWLFAVLYPTAALKEAVKVYELADKIGASDVFDNIVSRSFYSVCFQADISDTFLHLLEKSRYHIQNKCRNAAVDYYQLSADVYQKAFPKAFSYYELPLAFGEDNLKDITVRFSQSMNVPECKHKDAPSDCWILYTGELLNPNGEVPDISFVARPIEDLAADFQDLLQLPDSNTIEKQFLQPRKRKILETLETGGFIDKYCEYAGLSREEGILKIKSLMKYES